MKYETIKGRDFNYDVCQKGVEQIIFTDDVAPKGVELTDLSNDFDGSVVGWLKDGVYKVSTQKKDKRSFSMKIVVVCFMETMLDLVQM